MEEINSEKLKIDNLQHLKLKLSLSLDICEKVLNDFSNIIFSENVLINCERNCYDKYNLIYENEKNNKNFYFKSLNNEIIDCTQKCDSIYQQILDHQIKGAEISYVKIFDLFYKY